MMSVEKKSKNIEFIEVTPRRNIEFEYTWRIDNFSSSENYESPTLSPHRSNQIAFYLKLSGKTIRPTLCTVRCQIPDISLNLSLSLRDNGGLPNITRKNLRTEKLKINPSTSVQKYRFLNSFTSACEFSNENYDHLFWLSTHADVNKCLVITCIFQLNFGEIFPWGLPMIKVPQCVILDNLNKLFEKREFSDVIFEVCGQEIPAHKTILSMHSPVFAMMFEHEMKERLQNRVNVTDIEANVFTEMLRYIYTGKVENIYAVSGKLLAAAEKYDLARLKIMCEESLHVALTVENAADTLVLADHYNAELLKARAAEYMNLNIGQIMDTEGFQAMTRSDPLLMTEVLRATAVKFIP